MIPPEEVHLLKDDENTPDKRADKIWKHFGKTDKGGNSSTHFVLYNLQSFHPLPYLY